MVMRHAVDHNMVPAMRFMVMPHVDHRMVVPVVMPNMMVPCTDKTVMHFFVLAQRRTLDHNGIMQHHSTCPRRKKTGTCIASGF